MEGIGCSVRALCGAGTACLLVLAAPASGRAQQGAEDPATRQTMGAIFRSVSTVLPMSLDDERFGDPARRAEVQAVLDQLARDGARLEGHGGALDPSFAFLSRSLARDTREIRDRYAAGRVAEARFLLHEMIDDCVACHSRLPDDREHPLGERFVEGKEIASLPLADRARLEVATRQFDRALDTLEKLFASDELDAATLDLHGHFDDYLELAIRVKGETDRAKDTFEEFLERDDLSTSLRGNMTEWVASLKRLEKAPREPALARARELVRGAEDESRFPSDRRALVQYVVASGLLLQVVADAKRPTAELGEAYYLLGLIESRIGRSFWLSQTEYFLEAAIRLDPRQPYAVKAYDLLEEFVTSGYTGSGGESVPPDVRARLAELSALVQGP